MKTELSVKAIVESLGGVSVVAKICGLETPQSVSMWVSRDKIPPARLMFLKLARPEAFLRGTKKRPQEVA